MKDKVDPEILDSWTRDFGVASSPYATLFNLLKTHTALLVMVHVNPLLSLTNANQETLESRSPHFGAGSGPYKSILRFIHKYSGKLGFLILELVPVNKIPV